MTSRFQFRRANASAWTSANPTLAAGELGYELDTNKFKIGDGSTAWNSLSYFSSGSGSTAGTETLTNKTISFGSNTITGTLAQFNTALTDQDFASLAGTETLTNKTITSGSITLSAGPISTTTGTISGALINSTGNITATGSLTTSAGAISTSTGTVSAAALSSSGSIVTSTGTISGARVISTGSISTSTGTVSGAHIVSSGSVVATGTVSGAAVVSTGAISTSTGTISGAHFSSSGSIVTSTGTISGARIISTGSISTSTGTISGAYISSSGSVVATGTVSGAVLSSSGSIVTSTGTVSAAAGTISGSLGVGGSVTITSTVSASGLAGSLLSSTTPLANSAGSAGASAIPSRQDHSHPTTGLMTTTSPTIVATFSKAGTVAIGTGTFRWYNDTGSTLTIGTVRASVGTAPTGASLIVDVNVNGSTIYFTQANRPTIAASAFTATGSTKSTTTIANGDYFTVDIDQVGSTVAGSDLTVLVWLAYV